MVDPTPTDYHLSYLRDRWERDRSSRVFLQLAEEYRRRGLHSEALEVLTVGLAHHPGYLAAQVSLGRCRLDAGQGEEAIVVLERVLAQDPTQAVASRLLVDARLALRDLTGAREAISRCRLLGVVPPQELQVYQQRLAELEEQSPAPQVLAPPPVPAPPLVPAPAVATRPSVAPKRGEGAATAAQDLLAELVAPESSRAATPPLEATAGEGAAEPEERDESRPPLPRPPLPHQPLPTQALPTQALPTQALPTQALPNQAPPDQAPTLRLHPPPQQEAAVGEIFRLATPALQPMSLPRRPAPSAGWPRLGGRPDPFPLPPHAPLAVLEDDEVFQLPRAGGAEGHRPALQVGAFAEAPATGNGSRLAAPVRPAVSPAPHPAPAQPAATRTEPAWWRAAPAATPAMEPHALGEGPAAAPEPAPSAELSTGAASPAPPEVAPLPIAQHAPPAEAPTASAAPPASTVAVPPSRPRPLAGEGVEVQESGALPAPELRASDPGTATLGELYLRQGHIREAEEIFRQVLARDSENETALRGLEAIARRRTAALTAADLVTGGEPEVRGVTARKIILLERYLKTLRRGADSDVPRATE